ncbi:hypothetical protein GCM10009857_13240 [Agromyces soli]
MYEESLAATGVGTIVVGAAVVDVWWVAAAAIGIGALALVTSRAVRAARARATREE